MQTFKNCLGPSCVGTKMMHPKFNFYFKVTSQMKVKLELLLPFTLKLWRNEWWLFNRETSARVDGFFVKVIRKALYAGFTIIHSEKKATNYELQDKKITWIMMPKVL